jgi:GTP cyclohydrolase IA
MKQSEILLSTQSSTNDTIILTDEEIGDNHIMTSVDTPMRPNAFDMTDEQKMDSIAYHFTEIFSGLNPANKPKVALFDNKYQYNEMLVEKDITFYSNCEHHFVPIIGRAHVAYQANGRVIGLSKLNRIVQYFAKRPQVQERLTVQIANELSKILGTDDVAVVIDAKHLCVSSRGVEDVNSSTITAHYGGVFKQDAKKAEFLKYLEWGSN